MNLSFYCSSAMLCCRYLPCHCRHSICLSTLALLLLLLSSLSLFSRFAKHADGRHIASASHDNIPLILPLSVSKQTSLSGFQNHTHSLSLSLLEYRNQRQRLSPSLGPWIALDHEFTLLIRSILILPIFTFLTKLIHFTGTNGTILLSTGETNNA